MAEQLQDASEVYQIRKQKLAALRQTGFNFPNDFHRKDLAQNILNEYQNANNDTLSANKVLAAVAGRMMLRRIMGKASFFHIQDGSGRIQIYVKENDLPETYEQFKHWDLGDIIAIEGYLFKTKTEELSIHATKLQLLTKAVKPLPDKFHGLADQEMRYRKRYLDLIANPQSREVFLLRSKLIKVMREFMDEKHFLEVETPMMHPIPGGAIARPFVTHHNTLDMQLYLRIAPELYLKRLIVAGFERVYEINRNFRNEGISTRHNPEFTMIEFYQAYATYQDLMVFTEQLMHSLCDKVLATRQLKYQDFEIDFTQPFKKLSVTEAILQYHPELLESDINDLAKCRNFLTSLGLAFQAQDTIGTLQMIIFEETVEDKLIQPTFITHYPTEVSPLAKRNAANQNVTDRFEFFIAGREIANGFSELNDPEDQAERFAKQAQNKNAGDVEAMHYDADYIEALEYGMPPTAGEGIGIDRLVMLFANVPSIRDVILFPLLRKDNLK